MDCNEIALSASAGCGLMMVGGGLLLLWNGAIKLASSSRDPAMTVELFAKRFTIVTRSPALALFVIGLLFSCLSLWFANGAARPMVIVGQTADDYRDFQASVSPGKVETFPGTGHLKISVNAVTDSFLVTLFAPCYEPIVHSVPWRLSSTHDLGTIQLVKNSVDCVRPATAALVAPPVVGLPPLNAVAF